MRFSNTVANKRMSFEFKESTSPMEQSNVRKEEESEDKVAKIAEEHYKQFPQGLARDAERALNQTERLAYLKSEKASPELKELYEKITEIVDSEYIVGYTEQILQAVKFASMQYIKDHKDMEGFTGYDYDIAKIREELEKHGVPVKKEKSRADLQ